MGTAAKGDARTTTYNVAEEDDGIEACEAFSSEMDVGTSLGEVVDTHSIFDVTLSAMGDVGSTNMGSTFCFSGCV